MIVAQPRYFCEFLGNVLTTEQLVPRIALQRCIDQARAAEIQDPNLAPLVTKL